MRVKVFGGGPILRGITIPPSVRNAVRGLPTRLFFRPTSSKCPIQQFYLQFSIFRDISIMPVRMSAHRRAPSCLFRYSCPQPSISHKHITYYNIRNQQTQKCILVMYLNRTLSRASWGFLTPRKGNALTVILRCASTFPEWLFYNYHGKITGI